MKFNDPKNVLILMSLLCMTLFFSCKDDEQGNTGTPDPVPTTPDPVATTPNVLLIIADDMGKDATDGFSEGSIKPNTPNINALKDAGVTFTNLWVNPTCSPTRSSIITGKYGYRTGVKWAGDVLQDSETILQKYISDQTNDAYATAIVGKWHLAGTNNTINPETFGMDYYAGIASGAVRDYHDWTLTEDGATSNETTYVTEHLTDLAIDWVAAQDKPWFLWLAYNAPHTPFHIPPADMHSQGDLPDYVEGVDDTPYFMAAIEAMDFQIGKLTASIDEDELANTVIIFLGDNGTPNQVGQDPYSSQTVKGTLYQGGVNTPMYVSGKDVTRTGEDANLICGTDLYTTISNLVGIEVSELNDSKSFASLLTEESTIRSFQYTEMDSGNTDAWAISDGQFKLITYADGEQEMYNLINDPYEDRNVFMNGLNNNQEAAKVILEEELARIRG